MSCLMYSGHYLGEDKYLFRKNAVCLMSYDGSFVKVFYTISFIYTVIGLRSRIVYIIIPDLFARLRGADAAIV